MTESGSTRRSGPGKVEFPCFSDFSPELLAKDVQRVFKDISSGGDPNNWIKVWTERYFATRSDSKTTRKSAKNIKITLSGLGLLSGDPPRLSTVGEQIASAQSPAESLRLFLRHVLVERHG